MAQPVWVLSVDLQTKTATFQTGLADAAKAARGSFNDIKSGAGEMGGEVGYSMMEARHSVMILGEEFGVHLPRALTSFIASIGPLGGALEAAFPFLAIALGATLLIEHLVKMHEAGEKLTEDQVHFGTAVNNAFNSLDEKIIQAQIRSDELKNNHLGALRLQLELIDKQSMGELVHAFEEVAKAADEVMKGLEGHWYTVGIGSDGANHALKEFGLQYGALAAQGNEEAASGLLKGTLAQAQKVLALQKEGAANSGTLLSAPKDGADISKAYEAQIGLKKMGVGWTEKEIAAQEQLVEALTKQVGIEERVSALKKLDSNNAKTATGNEGAAQAAQATRQSAESQMRMCEQALAAERATADAALTVHRASLEQRLASDIDFAGRERDISLAANQAELDGLDRSAKDYTNQVKSLKEKSLEITNEYDTKVAELTAKTTTEQYSRDLAATEQGEREKIGATQQGSAARLAAIDAAIRQEEAAHLQDTSFFRELLNQRVETLRQETEEEGKVRDAALKQEIDAQNKAAQEQTRHSEAMNKIESPKSTDDAAAKQVELDKECAANHAELVKELADAQMMGQAKVAEERKINDQMAALDKKYQDQKAELAAQEAQTEKAAAMDVANAFGQSMLRVAEGHESMAKMAQGAFAKMVSASLEAALMEVAHEKTAQLAHAEAAAAAAMHAMSGIPVIGPALGLVAGAATFAAAMAFEVGGVVPGIGRGDTVPAMLSPGEGIVPGGVMDNLSKMAREGGFNGRGHTYNLHLRPTYNVQTIDGDGMGEALEKHTDQLQRHFENTLRKMSH